LTAAGKVLELNRTTYHLPKEQAAVLATFFRHHLKAQVLELRVEGDKLTVTTTPQTQQAIGQLITLIQGKKGALLDGGKGKLLIRDFETKSDAGLEGADLLLLEDVNLEVEKQKK
jgi:hypothetical protein